MIASLVEERQEILVLLRDPAKHVAPGPRAELVARAEEQLGLRPLIALPDQIRRMGVWAAATNVG